MFQVPAALPVDVRSVLRLIKPAGPGSCARGDSTDNIPHETQALELLGRRHNKHSGAVPELTPARLLVLQLLTKRWFVQKNSEGKHVSSGKLEMEIVLM